MQCSRNWKFQSLDRCLFTSWVPNLIFVLILEEDYLNDELNQKLDLDMEEVHPFETGFRKDFIESSKNKNDLEIENLGIEDSIVKGLFNQ